MTDEPTTAETPARNGRLKRTTWIIIAISAVLILAAAIAIPVSIGNAQAAAAEAAQRAADEAAQAAAEQAERDRLTIFNNALGGCGVQHFSSSGITILDGGEAVEIDGVAESFASPLQLDDVECFLSRLGAPSTVASKMGQTRALDGRQDDSWDRFTVEWSYHPDTGMNVIIEQRQL